MQFSLFKKSESDDEEKKIGHYHHYRYGHKSLELAPNLAWLAHDGATRNWRTEAQDKVSMHITEEKEFFWPNASGGILVSIHHQISIHLALPSKIRKLRPRRRKEIFGGQGQRSFSDDAAANGDVAMVPCGCQSQALEWPGRGPYGRLGVRLQLHWDNGREAPSSALRLLRGSCEACVRKPAAGHSSPKKLKVGFSLISSRFQSGLPPPSLLAWDCGCMRAPFAKRKLPRPSIGRIPKKPWFPTVKCACLLACLGARARGIPVLESVSRPQSASANLLCVRTHFGQIKQV